MATGAGSSDSIDARVKELADRLSKLEGMSGAKAGGSENTEIDLRQQLQQTLARLKEIQAALGTESGELESIKAAREEAEKLQAVLKKKDYRILHLTRALDSASGGKPSATAPP